MGAGTTWLVAALLIGLGFVAADGALPPTAVATTTHANSPAWMSAGPRMGTSTSVSDNWAGYVISTPNNATTKVVGSWVEPSFHGSCGGFYNESVAVFWVGIDGWNSNTVEQIGTTVECYSVLYIASVSYSAWYEFYPAGMVSISMTIHPGDHITAEVSYSKTFASYTVSLKDTTTGTSFATAITGITANRSSAEWIAEAPSNAFGVLAMADFGTVHFSAATATISGHSHPISGFSNIEVTMWSTSYTFVKAVPSALGSTGKTFSVKWKSYGP